MRKFPASNLIERLGEGTGLDAFRRAQALADFARRARPDQFAGLRDRMLRDAAPPLTGPAITETACDRGVIVDQPCGKVA